MLRLNEQVARKISSSSPLGLLDRRPSLSEIFHENTKLFPLSSRVYGQAIAALLKSPEALKLMAAPYKIYSLMDQEELAAVAPMNDLERAIVGRRSVRSYAGKAITRDELARLLFFSYGRTDPRQRFRAVASGGALYPLELYAISWRVDGLEDGVYHYNVERHCLDVVRRGDRFGSLRETIGFEETNPNQAALMVVITAIFRRTTFKYRDRGYRMVLLEAGEVAQNLALLATSMGLGTCLLGGFLDDSLSGLLEIDGVEEAPLLPVLIGSIQGDEANGKGR